MAEFDYRDDLKIDPHALDIEWIEQPNLYMRYAEKLAHAERIAKRLDEKVKTIRSELIDEANKELDKPNQQNVEAYYRRQESYKEAKKELHDAEFEQSILNNAVWAMGHRKTALENMVKLMAAQYFASPLEPRNLTKIMLDKTKEERIDEKIKRVINRKRGGR